jgi:hypothetical protein
MEIKYTDKATWKQAAHEALSRGCSLEVEPRKRRIGFHDGPDFHWVAYSADVLEFTRNLMTL